ncbi:MAG: hypothetical protein Q8P18_06195 [Pseudomonadota bacterium]|nr:hypothetical protein [Pseudomonadota bacterium]
MAEILLDAPPVVALDFDDDGWTAACLRIGGRTPVWASSGNPSPCADALAHLGLPGLGVGIAGATLRVDLSWAPGWSGALLPATPPPVPRGTPGPLVTILLCTGDRADVLPRTLASAQSQSWPCEVRVVAGRADEARSAALADGIAEARGSAILVLEEGDQLLPGAVRVLATALFADPTLAAVWGDTVVCDPVAGTATTVHAACRLPAAMVGLSAQRRTPACPGATLARTSVWRAAFPVGQPPDDFGARRVDRDLPRALAALGPVAAVPLPVLVLHGSDHRLARTPEWTASSSSPFGARVRRPQPGALLVVDDGDDGALEATLHLRASDQPLFVSLEVPRDPLDEVVHYWPGTYASQARLFEWGTHHGPVRLALTSAPGWAPPPLDDLGWLPDLRGPEAVLAVAAALGWSSPLRTRPGLPQVHGAISSRAWQVRRALELGRPGDALVPLGALLTTLPGWRGAWLLAAETYAALGRSDESNACRVRALGGYAVERNAYAS